MKQCIVVICENCSSSFKKRVTEIKKTKHNFCSTSCAAIFNNQHRKEIGFSTKGKTKKSNCDACGTLMTISIHHNGIRMLCAVCKNIPKIDRRKEHYCKTCYISIGRGTERQYCNACLKQAQMNAGRASAASQGRRSKNEIYFADLCQGEFDQVLCNERLFVDDIGNKWDADIILPHLKIAVLWNGIWHYHQISKNQSLLQVQSRDKIKFDVIVKNGYMPYIIKDMGKHNKSFVNSEFEKFIKFLKTQ